MTGQSLRTLASYWKELWKKVNIRLTPFDPISIKTFWVHSFQQFTVERYKKKHQYCFSTFLFRNQALLRYTRSWRLSIKQRLESTVRKRLPHLQLPHKFSIHSVVLCNIWKHCEFQNDISTFIQSHIEALYNTQRNWKSIHSSVENCKTKKVSIDLSKIFF